MSRRGWGRANFDGYATGQVIRERRRRDHGRLTGRPVRGLSARRARRASPAISRAASATATPEGQGSFNQSHYSGLRPGRVEGVARPQPQPRSALGAGAAAALQGKPGRDRTRAATTTAGSTCSGGRWNPVQWFPESFDILQWSGGDLSKTSIPYQNLSTEGCYSPHWDYFQPRFGLAWKMFGTNRTVLRVGAGTQHRHRVRRPEGQASDDRTSARSTSPRPAVRSRPSPSASSTTCRRLRPRRNTAPATTTRWTGRRGGSTRTT